MYFCMSEFWTVPARCFYVYKIVYKDQITQYHFSFSWCLYWF